MSPLRSRHKCAKCDKYFSTDLALSQHIKNHRDISYAKKFNVKPSHVKLEKLIIRKTKSSSDDEDTFAKTDVPTESTKFPCPHPHCGSKLGSKTALQSHVKSVHVDSRNFSCSICSNSFRNLRDLNVHKKKVHGPKKFKCAQCPMAFTMSCSLTAHVNHVHTTSRNFECTLCEKKFKEKGTLSSHVASVHAETSTRFECDICKKFYKTVYAMKSHQQNVHQDGQYECDLCPKTFTRRDTMLRHKKMSHLEPSSPVKCTFPKCGKVFTFESSMQSHYQRIHEGKNVKKFPCYFCDKMFECPSKMVDHTRSHTREMPFKCGVCRKEFSTHGLLKRHEPTHVPKADRKQFKCPICSRRSFYSFDLKNHMRKEHGSSKRKTISESKRVNAEKSVTHTKETIFNDNKKKLRPEENVKISPEQKRTVSCGDAMVHRNFRKDKKMKLCVSEENEKISLGQQLCRSDATIMDTSLSKDFVPTTPNSDTTVPSSPLPYIKIETETLRETDDMEDGMDIVHSIFVGESDTISECEDVIIT